MVVKTPHANDRPEAVRVGSILLNNDPRVDDMDPCKRVTVIEIVREGDEVQAHWYAVYLGRGVSKRHKIDFQRIHLDGKYRHQGYNLVS